MCYSEPDILSQEEVDDLLNAINDDFFFSHKHSSWGYGMGYGKSEVTKCSNCAKYANDMCKSDYNRENTINEIKRAWEKLDNHIPATLKSNKFNEMVAYFLEVMDTIDRDGVPLPKCTYNNPCFTAKTTSEKSDCNSQLDSLFGRD